MPELLTQKTHDESRQGEAYAPFTNDPAVYRKRFYIESYGCAMNFADSEVVASILSKEGFGATRDVEEADLIFLNTCSIREKAEQTVRKRLTEFRKLKKRKPGTLVGVLGCMAERLKAKFLEEEKLVDIVVGPDAYRSLPGLVEEAETGQKAINVLLSRDETYADISPIRLNSNGISAFVSIMRGCNNMCSFCVVPFTRGRERSRDAESIVNECRELFENGYREVTLLGQNVDSYYYQPGILQTSPQMGGLAGAQPLLSDNSSNNKEDLLSAKNNSKSEAGAITFAKLLEQVALISPLLRIRFSTSHPKDITDDVLFTMAKYENICNYIHLPVQSGSTRVLQLMNRTYTREWYKAKVDRIREILPGCGLSSDIIAGFCTETEEDHQDTLSIMDYSKYDYSYMFFYSERPGTLAQRRYTDDIPLETKKRRLAEIVEMQNRLSLESNLRDIGKIFKVLIESTSKKRDTEWMGRTSENKVMVFPKENYSVKEGDYVLVKAEDCTQGTLMGHIADIPQSKF
ncbi:MiaB/RimO family radical SAM methylthiotransferase [Terrimonas pollutisoli]|uniref:MiaB/RimO family radical SAM methylthiotransferase n=1 Tax=Terrimonas pollutisoli TaxID=3034147 RepID=UPI0023EBEE78|nr:radical SAM protein [Terrimonas sp. H1YJ31]